VIEMKNGKRLRFALPIGSLNDGERGYTEELLKLAGFDIFGYNPKSRVYAPIIRNDSELEAIVDRPQNMPPKLEAGTYGLAILGSDIACEWSLAGVKLELVCNLSYGSSKLVAAVDNSVKANDLDSFIRDFFKDGAENKTLVCATEYPLITSEKISLSKSYKELFGRAKPLIRTKYCTKGENKFFEIVESYGATESAINPQKSADLIVETTSSGKTLLENGLKPIGTIFESSAGLYTTQRALKDDWKREKIEFVRDMLLGAVRGMNYDYVIFNVEAGKKEPMDDYLKRERLFASEPTVNKGDKYVQFSIQIPKTEWPKTMYGLKQNGAEEIIRLNPYQVIK
jgi:ATP phosphoribosyltransferase